MLPLTPVEPFLPNQYRLKLACAAWERHGYAQLRRAVFCGEQGLFMDDDQDELDAVALPIVALTCVLGMPDQVVGGVRIHSPAPGVWHGSRLAVHAEYRQVSGIGSELIRHAVSIAHARGCQRFLAQVQARNLPLFRRLHWRSLTELTLHGQPHHLMEADLAHYPPRWQDEYGWVGALRSAA